VAQEVVIFIEYGDTVEPLVGDVDVFLIVHRNACGPDQLPRGIAGAGELGDDLLVARLRSKRQLGHADTRMGPVPGDVGHLFPTPVQDIEYIVFTRS
jgi:hypothetical protein